MSVKDLKRLLQIRVFRRDEKERLYMQARNYLNQCQAEKQSMIQRHIELRRTLPAILAQVQARGRERALTAEEWSLAQAELNQGRATLGQLEHFITQAEHKCVEAAEKMEAARLEYMEVRKAHDRLETMLKHLAEEERVLEEIMSEMNDESTPMRQNRNRKPIRKGQRRRR